MRAGAMTGKPSLKRPQLADVTLVAVSSVAVRQTVAALQQSMRQADFGRVLLLSDQPPPADTDPAIGWRRIERIASRAAYSRFMLKELIKHIDTKHALCVQWDGFVLNGCAWDPGFLEYDYIGAVWPQFTDGHNVGNGGFSLRSTRLLEACVDLPVDSGAAEDLIIARVCRTRLEQQGVRFAPEPVARRFAYERTAPTGNEYGFHGAFNLVEHLSPPDAFQLFKTLEPGMLARSERIELLRWALVRGHFKLMAAMLMRLA